MVADLGSELVKALITGAAGMIGRKLRERLAGDHELILHDVVSAGPGSIVSDLSTPGEAEKLVAGRPDVIFHLAAIVSGEAEADFEKGYRINLVPFHYLLEAIRCAGGTPPVACAAMSSMSAASITNGGANTSLSPMTRTRSPWRWAASSTGSAAPT